MDKATVASLKILENLDWGWDLTGVRGPTGVGARRVSGPGVNVFQMLTHAIVRQGSPVDMSDKGYSPDVLRTCFRLLSDLFQTSFRPVSDFFQTCFTAFVV